jgi:hypothetical protein
LNSSFSAWGVAVVIALLLQPPIRNESQALEGAGETPQTTIITSHPRRKVSSASGRRASARPRV